MHCQGGVLYKIDIFGRNSAFCKHGQQINVDMYYSHTYMVQNETTKNQSQTPMLMNERN